MNVQPDVVFIVYDMIASCGFEPTPSSRELNRYGAYWL
jgi:hypothetical protein